MPRIFWSRVYIFNYIASVCRKDLGNALTTPLLVTLSLCVAQGIYPEYYKHGQYTLAYAIGFKCLSNSEPKKSILKPNFSHLYDVHLFSANFTMYNYSNFVFVLPSHTEGPRLTRILGLGKNRVT